MQEQVTESLFDVPDRDVTIETTADVIKPIIRYVDHLVDEFKLQVDNDGLHYAAVDPSNVTMVTMDAPIGAFDTFAFDMETELGVPNKSIKRALRAGRMRQEDEISIEASGDYLSTQIDREYDGAAMTLQNRVALIDTDAIRQEPEMPEVDVGAEATIPIKAFQEGLKQIGEVTDHVELESENGDLILTGKGDTDNSKATIENVVTGDDETSIFALYYLQEGVSAFKKAKAEEFTIHLGTEYPMLIEATTTLNDAEVDLQYLQAPRVHSDPRDS